MAPGPAQELLSKAEYSELNRKNWDERAPVHFKSPSYSVERLLSSPTALSGVVTFDLPLLCPGLSNGDTDYSSGLRDLDVVHLQCHIGTDTVSLARLGARTITGLDFSPAAITEGKKLVSEARARLLKDTNSPADVHFVLGDMQDPRSVFEALGVEPDDGTGKFDLVYTGIGALCWLAEIRTWAHIVATLLRPGGRLFIREGHPSLWSIDETKENQIVVGWPYFETKSPMLWEDGGTYVLLPGEDPADEDHRSAGDKRKQVFAEKKTAEWNHGIGEIVQALLDEGMMITGLKEHRSVPWNALPGKMIEREDGIGEMELKDGKDNLPLSYTLQAVKK